MEKIGHLAEPLMRNPRDRPGYVSHDTTGLRHDRSPWQQTFSILKCATTSLPGRQHGPNRDYCKPYTFLAINGDGHAAHDWQPAYSSAAMPKAFTLKP
ncbi:hypothetical protein [Aquitalea magnusonii]|uniref:hypothetical protein n=1 Tax=Aquitalea magnusonii TaxID=332411 RepID=UPI000B5C2DCE|nr:hypothetical protein [Aquitalea magnusonii]